MSANTIYFAQHGLAVDKSIDPHRPLSDSGSKQTETMAHHLQQCAVPVSHIFHSGKLRAEQTAEIFASILNVEKLDAIDFLAPNDDVSLLAAELNIESALYVGHLPHLGKIVSYLVSGNEDAEIVQFKNSAVIRLQQNNKHYQVQWYITPESISM